MARGNRSLFPESMKRLTNHVIATFVTLLIFAPVFAAENIGRALKEQPPWLGGVFIFKNTPWFSGSIFITGMVLFFLALTVFAPVSSISNYLIENRYMVPVLAEPLVTLGVMALYVALSSLVLKVMTGGVWLDFYLSTLLAFSLPTLLYWLMLRLTSNWEYEH